MSNQVYYYIAGGILAVIVLSFFFKPARVLMKGGLKTAFGFIGLIAINYAGQFVGISLGINLINSLLLGLLGLPGLGVSFFLQWIY